MGFRNPFRFKVDEETGWSLLADYGPDAGAANPDRGPQGSVEYNVITEPGNFGWPYCVRQNTPYIDWTFPSGPAGDPFDCEAPVNESPNNTGLTDLPPVEPATMWMGYSDTDARVPGLGTGGAPMAGPRYYFDPVEPLADQVPGGVRRQVVHRGVEQRLDQDRRARRGRQREQRRGLRGPRLP